MQRMTVRYTMKLSRVTLLPAAFFLFLIGIACSSDDRIDSQATDSQTTEWIDLLEGGDATYHWRGYNMDHVPAGWSVSEGVLAFEPTGEGRSGDLITRNTWSDFELQLEYRISEGGNSGIMHHGIEQEGLALFWSAPEFQVLDDPAYAESGPDMLSASLYSLIAPEPQNTRPTGEWNEVMIRSTGPRVEYWQNGEMVLSFDRWTAEWFERVRGTKFEPHPSFGTIPEGHIGFQDHGDAVWFRNIRIRALNP